MKGEGQERETDFPKVTATVEDVHDWAIKFLRKKNKNPNHADILKKQEVDGEALLLLTKADLQMKPYEMPGGPASVLAAEIERHKPKTTGRPRRCFHSFISRS